MELIVRLNGTDVNPYHKFGFTQNPFPQIAQAERMFAMTQLNKLGAKPIPRDRVEPYIRETLAGWSEEFIQLCLKQYQPAKMVEFKVHFPE